MMSTPDQEPTELEQHAAKPEISLAREFVDFLRQNKKWWLAPILITLLLLAGLVLLSGTAAAPFIYTLF